MGDASKRGRHAYNVMNEIGPVSETNLPFTRSIVTAVESITVPRDASC